MGSGKSTVVESLYKLPFLTMFGNDVVLIEADKLKTQDPFFQELLKNPNLKDKNLETNIHKFSTEEAEKLLVSAVAQRRDIIMDGTLSWIPFFLQTIQFIRDNSNIYERGEGYIKHGDGTVTEKYWRVLEKAEKPLLAYQIWVVGVTSDPKVAFPRGFVRQIITGRGVPVHSQLRSHRLFSENFEEYVNLVDGAMLYDNSAPSSKPDSDPTIIFTKELNGTISIQHPQRYKRFLKKKSLNDDAQNADELYTQPCLTNGFCDFLSEKQMNKLEQDIKCQTFKRLLQTFTKIANPDT